MRCCHNSTAVRAFGRGETLLTTLRIREAAIEDAPEIARIQVIGWQHAYRGQMPQDFLDNLSIERRTEQYIQWLSSPPPKSHRLLATQGDQVVGFSIIGASPNKDATEQTGHLYALYLDPAWIGKGVGAALMRESIAVLRAEGFTSATLWVLDTNTSAQGFYEHQGWVLEDGVTNIEWIGDFRLLEFRYRIALTT
jgi:ribosomal protein S18 acetylase RimI-like enzyme